MELVVQGMTFAGLERFVQKWRQQFVNCLVLQIQQQLLQQNFSIDVMSCLQHDTAVKRVSEPMSSNNILQQCFVLHFFEKKRHVQSSRVTATCEEILLAWITHLRLHQILDLCDPMANG